ncbi:hypothetical protein HK096_010053, partial [Nowakowskiella sp. JEL0078]
MREKRVSKKISVLSSFAKCDKTTEKELSLVKLPKELVTIIFTHLATPSDFVRLLRTCRYLSTFRNNTIFKALAQRQFPKFTNTPSADLINSRKHGSICTWEEALRENWYLKPTYNYYTLPTHTFMATTSMWHDTTTDRVILGSNDTHTTNGLLQDFLIERSVDKKGQLTISRVLGSGPHWCVSRKGLVVLADWVFTICTTNRSHTSDTRSGSSKIFAASQVSPLPRVLMHGSPLIGLSVLTGALVSASYDWIRVWDLDSMGVYASYRVNGLLTFVCERDRLAYVTGDEIHVLLYRFGIFSVETIINIAPVSGNVDLDLRNDIVAVASWDRSRKHVIVIYDLLASKSFRNMTTLCLPFGQSLSSSQIFIKLTNQFIIVAVNDPLICIFEISTGSYVMKLKFNQTNLWSISDIMVCHEQRLLMITTYGGVQHVWNFSQNLSDTQTDFERKTKDEHSNNGVEFLGIGFDFSLSTLAAGDDNEEDEDGEMEY